MPGSVTTFSSLSIMCCVHHTITHDSRPRQHQAARLPASAMLLAHPSQAGPEVLAARRQHQPMRPHLHRPAPHHHVAEQALLSQLPHGLQHPCGIFRRHGLLQGGRRLVGLRPSRRRQHLSREGGRGHTLKLSTADCFLLQLVHGESEARTSVEGMARSLALSSRVGLSDDLRRFRPAPLKADEKEPEEGAAGC